MVKNLYSVDEVFENDPENSKNVLMKIPEEISEKLGWQPGDKLQVKILEGKISITKVNNE